MDILLTVAVALCYALACFFSLRSLLHILQLGSYQLPSYFRSLRRNKQRLVSDALFVVFAALIIWLFRGNVRQILMIFVFLLSAVIRLPKKAKKPLVYTSRLVRIFIVAGLIQCVAFVPFVIRTEETISLIILSAAFVLSPLFVVVSRLVMAPVDYAVRRFYIQDAKRKLKSMPDLVIIGVTGSFGKTSVKHYLFEMLSARFETLMTPGSYNTPMGVVRTIREQLRPTHEVFICEMGARHVGDIKELCDIVEPTIGIVTAVGEQHLETFKTFDNIKKTKLELADTVTNKGGVLFINGDSLWGDSLKNYPNAIKYGLSEGNDYRAVNISAGEAGMHFQVACPDNDTYDYTTNVLGAHSAVNILGAMALGVSMGLSRDELTIPIKRLKSVPHRLELLRLPDGVIIDDSFNSNPSGSRAALDTLSCFDGFRILITPGMVELGEREEILNHEFGMYAATSCDHVYLVGKIRTRPIYEGLIEGGFPDSSITVVDTFNEAMNKARLIRTNDARRVILIENDLPDNY